MLGLSQDCHGQYLRLVSETAEGSPGSRLAKDGVSSTALLTARHRRGITRKVTR